MSPVSDRAQLQETCACGGKAGPDGECAACRARRLHRSARGGPAPLFAPPVVQGVLASPGQPLEPSVRRDVEGRLGHELGRIAVVPPASPSTPSRLEVGPADGQLEREADHVARRVAATTTSASGRTLDLGHVRVHTDARAASSADAVRARAYTVGHHIVFGAGEYAPATTTGRALLAHELTHVVQERSAPLVVRRAPAVVDEVAREASEQSAEMQPEAAAPAPPAPEPKKRFEDLAREQPDVARRVAGLSRDYGLLVSGVVPVLEQWGVLGVLAEKPEAIYFVRNNPRVASSEQEIKERDLYDAKHLAVWLEHVLHGLALLEPLLVALASKARPGLERRFELRRTRLVAEGQKLADTPFMRSGTVARAQESRAAAAQQRIDKAVAYVADYVRQHWAADKPEGELRLHGTVVVGALVDKMKLTGDEIRDALDALRAESPDLLEGALFAGGTVAALLYRGIGGFQAYRTRGEGFFAGAYRGSRESLLAEQPGGKAGPRRFSITDKLVAAGWFVLGAFQGIGDAIINNVKSLLDIFSKQFWSDLKKFFTEQLPEFVKSDDTRFVIGGMMGQANADEERRLAVAEPEEYGRTLGHVFGSALFEIVMMFIGLGWVMKAVQASPRLMKLLAPLLKFARWLGELAAVKKVLQLVGIVSEGINAISRKVRSLLLRVPALTKAGKARRALAAAELAVEEALSDVEKAEQAARRALAVQDLKAAEKHMKDLEEASRKLESKVAHAESQGAGVWDPEAAAGLKPVETGSAPRKPSPAEAELPSKPRVGETESVLGKERALSDAERELAQPVKTLDGEHELSFTPEGEPVRCSDLDRCSLLSSYYRDVLKRNPELKQQFKAMRERVKLAAESGNAKEIAEAKKELAKVEAALDDEWVELTASGVEATEARPRKYGEVEKEKYFVDKFDRGRAIEKEHFDTLLTGEDFHRTPYQETIDGVKGVSKPKRIKGEWVRVYEDADVVSVKSTWITDPAALEGKVARDLGELIEFQGLATGEVRIKNVASRRLEFLFEQGTFQELAGNPGTEALLKRLAADAKARGVELNFSVYAHGRKLPKLLEQVRQGL